MSFQPDMIWQYAQFLKEKYHQKNSENVEIYASSKVSLKGRPSQTFINPKLDIAKVNNLDEMYSFVMKLE
jgi:hypothetical protein